MDFDYVVAGGGSAGRIAAAELATDPASRVLLLDGGAREPESYSRGAEVDYAMWNLDGWRWSDLLPSFESLEKRLDLSRRAPTDLDEECLRAAEDAGLRRKDDLDEGDLLGVAGCGATARTREPARATIVHAAARRIVFDGKTAVGVEFLDQVARARREVIVCAGALETPRLLMRSGVGPAGVVADVSAVGKNLMDQPGVVALFASRREIGDLRVHAFLRANAASLLPAGAADTSLIIRAATGEDVPRWARFALSRIYAVEIRLGKPLSRGPEPFAERDDLDTLMAGIRRARKLAAAFGCWRELQPGRRADLERFAYKTARGAQQLAGTCRMGGDSSSVVDTRLRVRGVERLRVADASVMPFVPVSPVNGPAMMIGLRAARFIAEEQQKVQRA
jgi:choline dehydrogenase